MDSIILKVVASRNDALILLSCVDGRIFIAHPGQKKVMPDSLILKKMVLESFFDSLGFGDTKIL